MLRGRRGWRNRVTPPLADDGDFVRGGSSRESIREHVSSWGNDDDVRDRALLSGGTKEQYEAALAAVHPGRDTLPEGQIFHAAGPYAGGWSIIAVHESKESWERFRDGVLMPRLKAGVKGGFAGQPREMCFAVDNLQRS